MEGIDVCMRVVHIQYCFCYSLLSLNYSNQMLMLLPSSLFRSIGHIRRVTRNGLEINAVDGGTISVG